MELKTPFTSEQFLGVFKTYNEAVFPVQILLYLLVFYAIYLTFRKKPASDKINSGVLSFFWLWMGIIYHLIFFTAINKAAFVFGMLFVGQGILILIFGVLRNKLSFRYHSDLYGITGIILLSYAIVIYPVFGYFMGHTYPTAPTFGLPCPTTIFTFGLLLMSDRKCPLSILIIPVIWSFIGFTAAFRFGIVEDIGLPVAGLVTFFMLVIRNRRFAAKMVVKTGSRVSQ